MISSEAGAGIMRSQRSEGVRRDWPRSTGRPVNGEVMHQQEHTIARELHIELHGIGTEGDRLGQRFERILGGKRAIAAMSDHRMRRRIK